MLTAKPRVGDLLRYRDTDTVYKVTGWYMDKTADNIARIKDVKTGEETTIIVEFKEGFNTLLTKVDR